MDSEPTSPANCFNQLIEPSLGGTSARYLLQPTNASQSHTLIASLPSFRIIRAVQSGNIMCFSSELRGLTISSHDARCTYGHWLVVGESPSRPYAHPFPAIGGASDTDTDTALGSKAFVIVCVSRPADTHRASIRSQKLHSMPLRGLQAANLSTKRTFEASFVPSITLPSHSRILIP